MEYMWLDCLKTVPFKRLNMASATCSHLNYFTNQFLKYGTKSALVLVKLPQILSYETMN